jgi:hypothetical protein
MNILRRTLMAIGGMAVVSLVIALAAPKAAHALVATLVQVVNTTANPVPTSLTDALNSFDVENACNFSLSSNGGSSGSDTCKIPAIYTVPAGKIAVVETVSGRCVTDTGTALREVRLDFLGNTATSPNSWLVPGPAFPFYGGEVVSFAQNQKTYISAVSADAPIDVEIFATAGQKSTTGADSCAVDISGHLQ